MIARASLTKSLHSSWWAKISNGHAAKLSWSGRSPGARAGRRGTGLPTDRAKDARAQALTRMQKQPRATLAVLYDEGGSGERHRLAHLAASLFCFASSAAKWRATALAAAALRLALNPSLLARIQSIDCERHKLRSSKRGNT
jgi:hypothetical protein